MRIWSLHPQYLDARGLAAAWREGPLAQAVLRGYRRHPQSERLRQQPSLTQAIATYLHDVHAEGTARGCRFDADRINGPGPVPVAKAQRAHLLATLRVRDPVRATRNEAVASPVPHPLFRVVPGGIEPGNALAAIC